MEESRLSSLERSASVMRRELSNLRKQVDSLKHLVRSEVQKLQGLLRHQSNQAKGDATISPTTAPRLGASRNGQVGPSSPSSTATRVGHPQGKASLLSELAVGRIQTCFKEKNGTPRQPSLCTMATGHLTIEAFSNPSHSLDGLQGYSHVWLLFVFHKNTGDVLRAKVRPPRLDGQKVGVFATRSPHRPCPIGLTLAKLERIEGDTLHLTGIDLIDGTPILDVKPYIPDYDTPTLPQLQDSKLKATTELQVVAGEGDSSNQSRSCGQGGEVKTAEWLSEPPVCCLDVQFLPRAEDQLGSFKSLARRSLKATQPVSTEDAPVSSTTTGSGEADSTKEDPYFLEVFSSPAEARQAIIEMLQQDPRSVYRRNRCKGQSYKVSIDNLNLSCQFEGKTVIVEDIQPKVLWERKDADI